VTHEQPSPQQEGSEESGHHNKAPHGEGEADQTSEATDPSGKPTIDEPTGPALDLGPDEFDKEAEDAHAQSKDQQT
jgi:hypothetical protein